MTILIAGAGIGGLTAALSLHAVGRSDVVVLEAAREIREIGVGINLPPHAVRELTELGLGEDLARTGVPTAELGYYDLAGKPIWTEPRGLEAGYRWPQYSIQRGTLQRILVEAVEHRLGPGAIHRGRRALNAGSAPDGSVLVQARDALDGAAVSYAAEIFIAADGIRSAVRDQLQGRSTPLASNGWVMFRGVSEAKPFLSGRSMAIIGDENQRLVVYPVGPDEINWLLVRPPNRSRSTEELGHWNVEAEPREVARFVEGWRFDWLDVPALIANTSVSYEYPMADIDPLPRWVFGRCALLGDAAHAMYPFGSNGASQAILDARILAYELATTPDADEALRRYEQARRPATAQVQLANRRQAGEVMARVSELARRQAHQSASAELQEVERRYKQLAGFDVETLNTRKSWSVNPAPAALDPLAHIRQ